MTHVRCHMDDARIAVETGVDGLDVVIGTSSLLREFSHGKVGGLRKYSLFVYIRTTLNHCFHC